MSLQVKPLDAALGAEVSNVDPGALTAQDENDLRKAFARYHLLLMRDRPISEEALVRYAACFGTLTSARMHSPLAQLAEIMVISNIRQDGEPVGSLPDGEVEWHFDRMHQTNPNKAAVLHAIEVTSHGGETVFSNMCKAYENLPVSTKRRIDNLTAFNVFDYAATREAGVSRTDSAVARLPQAVHPVVRVLPESGDKALWVAPLMTDRIVELSEEESQELLAELFAQISDPALRYEHHWRVGDTLIWDNHCLAHRRNDFDAGERRLLKRVAIG